jgi:hypothetical protein
MKVFTNSLKQPILPKLSILDHFDNETLELFLEWIADPPKPGESGRAVFSTHSLTWVYSILARLKLPLLEDISAYLARILTLVSESATAPFLSEPELASHKLVMVVIVNYFLCHKFFV